MNCVIVTCLVVSLGCCIKGFRHDDVEWFQAAAMVAVIGIILATLNVVHATWSFFNV
jgi:hypothetical protein